MASRQKLSVKTLVRDRFVRGEYSFGEKISAKALVEETGASRFMVISALNELRTEGFVEVTAQVGCEVISPTHSEIMDFFIVFSRVEGTLAEFAAERHAPAHLTRLRWINERLKSLDARDVDAGEAYRTLNLEIHQVVHDAARSPRLAARQTQHWAMADFFVTQASDLREHVADSTAEHDLVIGAIERRDGVGAKALMEAHIRRLGQDLVANLAACDASISSAA